uniref:Uncharacterized protein n=1 Tax=Parascaris equorum TaxID=6256 RepID=A0A914S897_PAREQ
VSVFILYVIAVIVVTLALVLYVAPRYGRSNILVYIAICSLIGSLSVLSVKGLGLAIKETLGGQQQFTNALTWFWLYNTSMVTPIYYVFFTTFVILASSILYKEWSCLGASDVLGNVIGFLITIIGIFQTAIPRDDHSTDETTLSLTPSEDRFLRANNDGFMNAENMRRNGWCNADGTSWMVARLSTSEVSLLEAKSARYYRPKDEAALLRRGLVNMHGYRIPTHLCRLASVAAGQASRENNEDINHNFVCGHYGTAKDPSVENYITDAEVNTRGYKDRLGRVFYAIPLLKKPKEKGPKPGNASTPHAVTVTNDRCFFESTVFVIVRLCATQRLRGNELYSYRSEHSIRDYNPNITTTSSERVAAETSDDSSKVIEIPNVEPPKGSHFIECEVGKGADSGHLRYFIEKGSRTYHLQGPQRKEVFLEFTKKVSHGNFRVFLSRI